MRNDIIMDKFVRNFVVVLISCVLIFLSWKLSAEEPYRIPHTEVIPSRQWPNLYPTYFIIKFVEECVYEITAAGVKPENYWHEDVKFVCSCLLDRYRVQFPFEVMEVGVADDFGAGWFKGCMERHKPIGEKE